MLSGIVIVFITILLYRKIESIGKIGVLLWAGVLLTMIWIISGGLLYGKINIPFHDAAIHFNWKVIGSFVFGQACIKTIYSYLGYYNICHLGSEIKNPGKNIPRSMFISVFGIALLYLAMNISVTSVIPWQEIKQWQMVGVNQFVISTFIERLYGTKAASVATVMILWVALASLFAVMLGYSRVPYAAAKDGMFFSVFAKLHPTRQFPYVSLLILAGIAFIFSLLFKMSDVISGILAMRIIIQFVGQAIGILLLRQRNGTKHLPYKIPFYPLPVIIAICIWLLVFIATGADIMLSFAVLISTGVLVYFIFARFSKQWPFAKKEL
jgi:amino acid transporter